MDGRSSKRAAKTIEIHLISDSTGDTAARVARAAQTQFSGHRTTRRPASARDDARRARGRTTAASPRARGVVVFFTIVDRELRRALSELCERDGIAVLRPARAAARGARPGCRARGRPRVRAADRARRRLLPARRRDGVRRQARRRPRRRGARRRPTSCSIGVSRTGKTPLSMYLGYLGYKTANVPLVRGIEPPGAPVPIEPRAHRRADDRRRAAGAIRGRRLRRARGALARRLCRAQADPRGARRGDAPSSGGSAAPCSTSRTSPSRRPRCASIELVEARRSP